MLEQFKLMLINKQYESVRAFMDDCETLMDINDIEPLSDEFMRYKADAEVLWVTHLG